MEMGLALSGGGFRATVFHLGVLERLAAGNLLESVNFVSTVSGGSLCVGLVYAASEFHWPTSKHYSTYALPRAYDQLLNTSLEKSFIWNILRSPLSLFRSRANDLSRVMQRLWGITADLKDIPDHPRWFLNATCFETARNWSFESRRMGDYVFGYSFDPGIPLADAMAGSAAFPGLVGALVLDANAYSWVRYKEGSTNEVEPTTPAFDKVHLWDGGVYDNLGVEGLFKPGGGYRDGVDFLIVSDASGRPKSERFRAGFKAAHRLVNIATDQVRSLRARSVVGHLVRHGNPGRYLQIDNTSAHILKSAGREDEIPMLSKESLPESEVRLAAEMETTIRQLCLAEFERLFRQGFEVADFTLYAYAPYEYPLLGYSTRNWG